MPLSPALDRLLRVRNLEEERHRLTLESALGRLHALESALHAARLRMHHAQTFLASSQQLIEVADRAAALLEIDAARRRAAVLHPRIAAARETADHAMQQYLAKRLERRQVETLIQEARAQEAAESLRRMQQSADEGFVSRQQRRKKLPAREDKA